MTKFKTTADLVAHINKEGRMTKGGFVMRALTTMSKTGTRPLAVIVASYIADRYKVSNAIAEEAATHII